MSHLRPSKFGIAVVLLTAAAAVPSALPAGAAPQTVPLVQATQSNTFVAHIGMDLHLADPGSPYGHWSETLKFLKTLGVRHVRTEFAIDRPDLDARLVTLADNGIHTDLVMSPTADTSDLGTRLDEVAALPPGVVESVEPPNEWNYNGPKATWAAEDQAYAQTLYSLVRGNPKLDGVKVLGPSLALRTGYSDLGNLSSSLDYGNIHLYPGGDEPTFRMDDQITNEKIVAGSKPDYVTETGYHNALHCGCKHFPIPETEAAIYEPRLFLDYFERTNVLRVYQYELYDTRLDRRLSFFNKHFGLIRFDGTPKPSFWALRRLISLTADPGPAFTAGQLAFSVNSGANPVQQVLLEKRDGSFTLFLWRDVRIWYPKGQRATPVPPINATVTFGQPISATAVYQPTTSSSPITKQTAPHSVTVSLAGQVDAIRIFPAH
jgi:hypothetical protein